MAVLWGDYVGTYPRQMRLGIEFTSVPAPTSSTQTSVTVQARVWLQCHNWFQDSNNTFVYSGTLGNGSGTRAINFTSMQQTMVLQNLSKSVALNSSGPSPVTIAASLTGIEYIGLSTKALTTKSTSIAAKPTAAATKPAAPASVTAVRVTDATTDVSWPAVSGATGYIVQRYDYANPSPGYVTQSTPSTNSYRSTNNTSNNRYDWRVAAKNSAGQSTSWAYTTDDVYTTPAAPTNIIALKSGGNIVVSLTDMSPHNTGWDWQVSIDGGAWEALGSTANASTSIQHTAPSLTSTHAYRARATIGALAGPWSAASKTVMLAAPPNKPTPRAPRGTIAVSQSELVFEWTHNPVDTTLQTAANLRYREVGTTTWTTKIVSGSANELVINPFPLSVGTYEWQVRTKGDHASYSDWSSLEIFEVGNQPVVELLSPTGTVASSRVRFSWSFSDNDGDSQTRAAMRLVRTSDSTLVWSGTVQGSGTGYTPSYSIDEGSYRAEITVTDSSGLTGTDTSTFVVAYARPAAPLLDADWDSSALNTAVTVASQTGAVATDEVRVERSIDSETWEVLQVFPPGSHSFTDPLTPLNQMTYFRAVAVSADGAEMSTQTISVFSNSVNGVINYGPGFANSLVLTCAIEAPSTLEGYGIEHILSQRALPVSVYNLDHEPPLQLTVSATLPGASVADTEALFKSILRGPVWWRDFERRSFGGRITNVDFTPRPTHFVGTASGGSPGNPRISFSVKQTDTRR